MSTSISAGQFNIDGISGCGGQRFPERRKWLGSKRGIVEWREK